MLQCVTYKQTRFQDLDLRENVCQVTALRPLAEAYPASATPAPSGHSDSATTQLPDIVVGNIHVLFNPKRGDVKLAQVRRSPTNTAPQSQLCISATQL